MLRRMLLTDLEAVAAIERRANQFPWPATQFADSLRDSHWSWVLEHQGRVSGFAIYSLVLDEASLLNIAVDPQCQRRGFGRRLLQTTLHLLREQGTVECFLEVRCSNRPAEMLYRSLGFSITGQRRDYYPAATGREDAHVMRCDLKEIPGNMIDNKSDRGAAR